MMATRFACLALAAALGVVGCGDDGDPLINAQVLYRLEAQGGGACFRMDHIASSGARHELDPTRVFTLTEGERALFVLANAQPPFAGRFDWVDAGCADSSGRLEVRGVEVQGPASETRFLDASAPSVTIQLRRDASAPISTLLDSPRVRVEVCSPLEGADDCVGGFSGRLFTGTIGDAFVSHIIGLSETDDASTTPSVVFVERPRDRVSGIFRGAFGQLLRAELYVDDQLEDLGISFGDVILTDDL